MAVRENIVIDYDCIGLPNLGNSCFLNVALQALRATPGVFNATAAHTQCVEECSIRNTPCVVSMCNKAFRKKPEELYNNLEGILDGYVAGQFVDGTEMFQVLLEHLEKVFDGDSYPFRHRICQFGTCECGQVVDLDVTSSVIDLGIKVDGVLMMSLDQCRAAKLSSDCTRCGAKFGIDIHTQVAPSSNVAFHFER